MGTFKARLGISDGNGGATQWIEALVDTGATYTVLPSSLLHDLVGIQPKREMEFTLADGRKMALPMGEARLYIEDRDAVNPVVFGEEGRYLIGATTLQVLGLIPDTTNHKLIPAPELLI